MPDTIPYNRCLPPETLRQFLANELTDDVESSVLAHLETCPHCQELCDSVARSDPLGDVRSKLVRLQLETEPTAVAALRNELYGIDDTVSRAGESDTQNIPAVVPSQLPREFGGYELLEEIARGGMGVVYKARQIKLDRIVAVKMILAGEFASDDGIRRFMTEAQAAAHLDHPHIVPIYEVGEHAGRHFYSMGYVEGQSLAKLTAQGPLPPREAAELMKQIAEAVHYAHTKGVIHRDLKPGNVLLRQRRETRDQSLEPANHSPALDFRPSTLDPLLTDFGLAKRVERGSELTSTGQVMGTPTYMSPEQARADATIGALADIYSLGAILYCLLTGRPAFQTASVMETLKQVLERDPLPPRQLNPDIPRDLETIALKCLEKSPDRRYSSAQAIADELDRYLHHRPITARPIGRTERGWRWCKRQPIVAGLTTLAIALLITIATVSSVGYRRQAKLTHDLQTKTSELEAKSGALQTKTDELATALKNETAERINANNREVDRRRELNKFSVAKGMDLADQGDLFSALLWFSKPLHPEEGPILDEEIHRLRLSCYWRLSTKPTLVRLSRIDEKALRWEFSPDGSQILTTSRDAAQVWNVATWEAVTLSLPNHKVTTAAFSPDGLRIVTTGDGIAQLWSVATGHIVGSPIAQRNTDAPAVFSPNGKLLLATAGNASQLYDAATGNASGPALTHEDHIRTAKFNWTGEQVVTASFDGTAQCWDAESSMPVGPAMKHSDKCYCAAFSPDGRTVVTYNERGVHNWTVETGISVTLAESDILTKNGPRGSAMFSTSGDRIVAVNDGYGRVRIWNATTLKPASPSFSLRAHIKFSLDGRLLHSGSLVIDMTTGEQVQLHPTDNYYTGVAFTSDGHRIVVGPSADNLFHKRAITSTQVLDASTFKPVMPTIPHVFGLRFVVSPESRRVLTMSKHAAAVWDRASTSDNQSGGPLFTLSSTAITPDGRYMLSGKTEKPRVWDTRTQAFTSPVFDVNGNVHSAFFSPDGRRLVTIGSDRTVVLWDTRAAKPIGQPLSRVGKIARVMFSPDSRLLVTSPGGQGSQSSASEKKTDWEDVVRVWDATTGREIGPPLASGRHVFPRAFAVSSSGYPVTLCSDDFDIHPLLFNPGTSQVWDALSGNRLTSKDVTGIATDLSPGGACMLAVNFNRAGCVDVSTGRVIGKPLLHVAKIQTARFSADGRRIVTASGDCTARVWDALTGEPIGSPMVHDSDVWDARFSHDGRMVVTRCSSTIRVWEVSDGQPISPPIPCRSDLKYVAFASDDQRVLGGSNSAVQVWDVSADTHTTEDWVSLTEVLSGRRIDRRASVEPLSEVERERQWLALVEKYPMDFQVSPDSVRKWHLQEFLDIKKVSKALEPEHLHRAGIVAPMYLTWVTPVWRYALDRPADNWQAQDFDDSLWKKAQGHFGSKVYGGTYRLPWTSSEIWLRRRFDLPTVIPSKCSLVIRHSGDAEVFMNGERIEVLHGSRSDYGTYSLDERALAALRPGRNVLAISCHHIEGDHFIDAGLVDDLESPFLRNVLESNLPLGQLERAAASEFRHLMHAPKLTP